MNELKSYFKELVDTRGKSLLHDITGSRADFYMTDSEGNGTALVLVGHSHKTFSQITDFFIEQARLEPLLILSEKIANPKTKQPLKVIILVKFADGPYRYIYSAADRNEVTMDGFYISTKIRAELFRKLE